MRNYIGKKSSINKFEKFIIILHSLNIFQNVKINCNAIASCMYCIHVNVIKFLKNILIRNPFQHLSIEKKFFQENADN